MRDKRHFKIIKNNEFCLDRDYYPEFTASSGLQCDAIVMMRRSRNNKS